jgi:hypothetical protein
LINDAAFTYRRDERFQRLTKLMQPGPMTVGRANELNAAQLLDALREAAAGHYRAIVKAKPDQRKYLRGWLTRAYE